jgi:hypothetical protein
MGATPTFIIILKKIINESIEVLQNEILLKFSVKSVRAYVITYLLHNGLMSLYN